MFKNNFFLDIHIYIYRNYREVTLKRMYLTLIETIRLEINYDYSYWKALQTTKRFV